MPSGPAPKDNTSDGELPVHYVSFLGIGNYQETTYSWEGKGECRAQYVQIAQVKLLLEDADVGPRLKRVSVFGTPSAKAKHWDKTPTGEARLKDGLAACVARATDEGSSIELSFVSLSEDQSNEAQWQTFQMLLNEVPRDCELVMDMTHGFRALPVVVSSALQFLRLTRGVRLRHVLYGLFDGDATTPTPMMDYRRFYEIADWTDAVACLVDDADASKLASLADRDTALNVAGFRDKAIAEALQSITDAIRNVEMHNIAEKARAGISLISKRLEAATAEGNIVAKTLLQLVLDKFGDLASTEPISGFFDEAYFETQLAYARLLLDHKLTMQACTAMVETIGSLGMRGANAGRIQYTTRKGLDGRRKADLFMKMVEKEEAEFRVSNQHDANMHKELRPYYEALKDVGAIDTLRSFAKSLRDTRNGLDHGWTSKRNASESIVSDAEAYFEGLRAAIELAMQVDVSSLKVNEENKRLIVLLNHELTEVQRQEIHKRFEIPSEHLVFPPPTLAAAWSSVSPEGTSKSVFKGLRSLIESWLDEEARTGDLILVQGEPGAVFVAVDAARNRGVLPLYATTKRVASSKEDQEGAVHKTSVFRHVQFREYP